MERSTESYFGPNEEIETLVEESTNFDIPKTYKEGLKRIADLEKDRDSAVAAEETIKRMEDSFGVPRKSLVLSEELQQATRRSVENMYLEIAAIQRAIEKDGQEPRKIPIAEALRKKLGRTGLNF